MVEALLGDEADILFGEPLLARRPPEVLREPVADVDAALDGEAGEFCGDDAGSADTIGALMARRASGRRM